MASNFAKLDKFEEVDFRRWHKKMHFLLMAEEDALLALQHECGAKYMAEDASSKKFLVSNFTNYKMTDSKPVMEQYNKLLDFKHTLKHLKEELTLVELSSHLRIEESLRVHDSDKPKGNNVVGPSVVNMVEHNNSSRYNDNKGKCKHHDNTKVDPNKKPKVTCWKCGKPGHLEKDCKGVNVGNKANGSGIKGLVDGSSNSLKGQNMFNKSLQIYYVTYVSKAYFVQDDDVAWWVNSGATIHTGHVHFKRMQDMSNDGLIPSFDMDTEKYSKYSKLKLNYNKGLKSKDSGLIGEFLLQLQPEWKRFVTLVKQSQELKTVSYHKLYDILKQHQNEVNEIRTERLARTANPLALSTRNRGKAIVTSSAPTYDPEPATVTEDDEMSKEKEIDKLMALISLSKEAINDEMYSIMGKNTWVLADLPPGCKPLGCKWIFKRKLKVDGTVEKFKESLIIHHMDVKTAFLNGELEEEAPKQWHQKFDEVVLSNGYLLNQADKCAYSKFDESGKGFIICLYVYDMLIFGIDQVQVDLTKEFFSSRFFMKDMGEADVILGIRIKHKSNEIAISQSYYIKKVLKKFNYFDCTPVSTPIDTSEKLMPNNGQVVSQLELSHAYNPCDDIK
ncbi:zinc finger, CCHC-type containing protein [Tanacetum coccineum]